MVDETDKLRKREAIIYEINKYFVEYKPETDTYNNGKNNKINFVEDDFDYNAKRRGEKRKIIYAPEELRFIANKRKKYLKTLPEIILKKLKMK